MKLKSYVPVKGQTVGKLELGSNTVYSAARCLVVIVQCISKRQSMNSIKKD